MGTSTLVLYSSGIFSLSEFKLYSFIKNYCPLSWTLSYIYQFVMRTNCISILHPLQSFSHFIFANLHDFRFQFPPPTPFLPSHFLHQLLKVLLPSSQYALLTCLYISIPVLNQPNLLHILPCSILLLRQTMPILSSFLLPFCLASSTSLFAVCCISS